MTALLSTFGLPNEVTLNPTVGLTAIPGLQNRYTLDTGPEGVMLCKISNLSEAFACGGLLLYDPTPDNQGRRRWRFWVKEMLLTALREGYLNSSVGPGLSGDGAVYHFTRVKQMDGGRIDQYGRAEIPWGGVLDMHVKKIDGYFAPASVISVMGVVTMADTGYGSSHVMSSGFSDFDGGLPASRPTVALGFMANYIPFPNGMADFLHRTKEFALSRVSDTLREYYAATFEPTLAAWANKDAVPTITLPTFWANGVLTAGAQQKPKVFTLPVGNHIEWNNNYLTNKADLLPQMWNFGMVSMYDPPAPNYSATVLSANPVGAKYAVRYRAGHWDSQGFPMPLMDVFTAFCDSEPFVEPTGMAGTFNVGTIRDGHVLKRSQVDGLLYGDAASSHADLGAVVTQYIDKYILPDVDFTTAGPGVNPPAPTDTSSQEATAASFSSFDMKRTIYQMGSLPSLIEQFNDLWDSAAKSAAHS